jgi:hypothetical protein
MTPPLNKIKYDTYISYSHSDEGIVTKIADRLQNQVGSKVFFDKEAMGPGDKHSKIHESIYQSKTFIACIGKEKPKDWHSEEIDCAIQRAVDDKNFKVMAILLSGKTDENVPPSLKARTWIDLSKGDYEENFKKILSFIDMMKPIDHKNNQKARLAKIKDFYDDGLIEREVLIRAQYVIIEDVLSSYKLAYDPSDMLANDPRDMLANDPSDMLAREPKDG